MVCMCKASLSWTWKEASNSALIVIHDRWVLLFVYHSENLLFGCWCCGGTILSRNTSSSIPMNVESSCKKVFSWNSPKQNNIDYTNYCKKVLWWNGSSRGVNEEHWILLLRRQVRLVRRQVIMLWFTFNSHHCPEATWIGHVIFMLTILAPSLLVVATSFLWRTVEPACQFTSRQDVDVVFGIGGDGRTSVRVHVHRATISSGTHEFHWTSISLNTRILTTHP